MQLILKSVEHKAKKAFHGDQEIKGCSERMSVPAPRETSVS